MIYKYSKFLIIIFIVVINSCSGSKVDTDNNSKKDKSYKVNTELENKGAFVTSVGELRTLIIYAAFADDSLTRSNAWNFSKTDLPVWTQEMINNSTKLNFPAQNLTQYFYEMSRGSLMLYGDIYPKVIVPKYIQSHYKSIAEVNYEILAKLDKEIDYSRYDNWSRGKDWKYVNKPDGKVDVIFIVYRNFENRLFFNNGWTGAAHLYLTEDIKTNDGVKISTGSLDKGSGIQIRGGKNGFSYTKYVLAHEFGHLLFGSGHIENATNLALMTGGPVWNASRGMHSWEREKLGWADFTDLPINENTTFEIDDYQSTGKAYRIKLSKKEWYILENHQKISEHDWAQDKGIYIYHVTNANRFAPKINIKCADGNWDFKIDKVNKKITKTIPNPSGKSEMNFFKTIKKKKYACYKNVYVDNSAWGDEYDAFDVEYNNLLSPVSNPSSKNIGGKDFAILIKVQIGNKYKVNIYFNDIYKITPPSKPQILELIKNRNELNLKWLENEEPDLAGYYLYFKSNKGKTISQLISQYTTSFNISKLLKFKNENKFWLTSIDSDNYESVPNHFSIIKKGNNWILDRRE